MVALLAPLAPLLHPPLGVPRADPVQAGQTQAFPRAVMAAQAAQWEYPQEPEPAHSSPWARQAGLPHPY